MVALITSVGTTTSQNLPGSSLIDTISLRGDGGSISTRQTVQSSITSTGPLGNVSILASTGINNITAPSIFGNIITSGPIVGTIQTTGMAYDAIDGALSMIPADLGRVFVNQTPLGPVNADTVIQAAGGGQSSGIAIIGRIVSRGKLLSQVIANGGISGLIASVGDMGTIANLVNPPTRIGGIVSNGPISGQIVTLGNFVGDLTASAITGGRIAVAGSVLGNTTISGPVSASAVLVAGGTIGSGLPGTTISTGNLQGLIAANGVIEVNNVPLSTGFLMSDLGDPPGNPSAAVIDQLFSDVNGNSLMSFDLFGLDLNQLTLLLQELALLHVKANGGVVDGGRCVSRRRGPLDVSPLVSRIAFSNTIGKLPEDEPYGSWGGTWARKSDGGGGEDN